MDELLYVGGLRAYLNAPEQDKLWQEASLDVKPASTLAQVWETVTGSIFSSQIRSLFQQHCELVAFNGTQAIVSVGEKAWGTVEAKLSHLKSAFAAVYGQDIEVLTLLQKPEARQWSHSKLDQLWEKVVAVLENSTKSRNFYEKDLFLMFFVGDNADLRWRPTPRV